MSLRELMRQKIVHEVRGLNSTMKVWDKGMAKLTDSLKGHLDAVRSVVLSNGSGNKYIVTGSLDGTVKVWDRESRTCLFTIDVNQETEGVLGVAISKNDEYIATAGADKLVKVWDVHNKGAHIKTLKGHAGAVNAVAFFPSSSQVKVVSASDDKTLKIFRVDKGKVEVQLKGHDDAVCCVAVSADGHHIASGSRDNTVRLWDSRSGKCIRTLSDHTAPVLAVVFTPSTQQVISGSMDTTIKVFGVGSGNCLKTLKGHTASVFSLALSKDGQFVVSGSSDTSSRVWNFHSGECVTALKSHSDAVFSVAATDDASEIIQGTAMNDEDWKVLIVDNTALKMINQCFRMSELMESGVTVVESISKSRREMSDFQAVYFCEPTDENVRRIIADFKPKTKEGMKLPPLYKNCNIFFLYDCPKPTFDTLARAGIAPFIRTLKEVHALFTPDEQRVFTLDKPNGLFNCYSPYGHFDVDGVATQLATVCETLDEVPVVRFASDSPRAASLAERLNVKLQTLPIDKKDKGAQQSQFIILGREVDLLSPIAHELTYQAAAMDLLNIKGNQYTYRSRDGAGRMVEKTVPLDESDPLWLELRHSHIAKAMREITAGFKEFSEKSKEQQGISSKGNETTKDMKELLTKLPQLQRQTQLYSLHLDIGSSINKAFTDNMEALTGAEQNILCGEDEEGRRVTDFMNEIMPIAVDKHFSIDEKIRCAMLYVLANNGTPKMELDSLLNNANIPQEKRECVNNLTHFGATVVADSKKSKKKKKDKRKEREAEYNLSRWTPIVKDIFEDAISGKLSTDSFPIVGKSGLKQSKLSRYDDDDDDDDDEPLSARRKQTNKKKGAGRGGWANSAQRGTTDSGDAISTDLNKPKVIIFILGSVSYSEMRAAYEVARTSGWECYIGSHAILSPTDFVAAVGGLTNQPKEDTQGEVLTQGEGEGALTIVTGTASVANV